MTEFTIRNARLSSHAAPVDVVIRDDVIASIEPNALNQPVSEKHVDAGGMLLLPGLWDEHVHTNLWAISRRRLDLTGVASAAEAVSLVAKHIDASHDEVFVGVNYRDALWPDLPTAAALDAITGERPVVLVSGDVHGTWLNSAAMARFGVSADTAGVISEDEAFRVQVLANEIDDATLDAWVAEALAEAASRGVVGIVDFEMRDSAADWVRRSANGQLNMRVEASVYRSHLDDAIREGRATGTVLDARGLVRAGYFKVITDGSLGTRTAWCSRAYPNGSHGGANVDFAELSAEVARAHAAGITPAIHAIGDWANTAVLDMFEALDVHGRLEHAQQVAAADVPRFAELGVTASVQPEHAMDDRDVAEQLWGSALDDSYRLRSLVDAGAALAFGSDAPVAPLEPWQAIASAVHRRRNGRDAWLAYESLSFEQALKASTRGVRIEIGQEADLMLVDPDVARFDADELRVVRSALTIVAGEIVHSML